MLVYGKNVINEILNNNTKIYKVFLDNNFKDESLLNRINKRNLKKFHMDKNKLDKMCGNSANQGIAADIEEYKYLDIKALENDNDASFVVMLDSIEDPHNFGAIIRTSEALGVDAIIIPNDRCCNINSTVVKTSAGAIYDMPIVRVNNLSSALNKLKKSNYWVFGTDMKGSDYTKVNYDMPVCLIIGNEGKGISKTLEGVCDYMITIPMVGKINSLNASVSCGIILSRIVAQRGENGI